MYVSAVYTIVDLLPKCLVTYFLVLLFEKGLVLLGVYIPGGQVAWRAHRPRPPHVLLCPSCPRCLTTTDWINERRKGFQHTATNEGAMTPYESGLVCAHASSHSSIHLENYRIPARKLLSQPPVRVSKPIQTTCPGVRLRLVLFGKG